MQFSLLELQQAFGHALARGDDAAIMPWIATEDAATRVAIYRNNSQTNRHNALRADYPVVERLVGREFFEHAANAYIAATPSFSGDVGDYGRDFPDFLAAFPGAASLPYLQDVARLELAWVDVLLATEDVDTDFSALGAIAEQNLGGIRFDFNPATRLLASSFPVVTIWQANQDGYVGDLRLNLGVTAGESVLLRRRNAVVELRLLEPGEYRWLVALHSGSRLSDAVNAAFAAQPDFDLSRCLHRHLGEGTFMSIFKEIPDEK